MATPDDGPPMLAERHSSSESSALSVASGRQREVRVGYHGRLRFPRIVAPSPVR